MSVSQKENVLGAQITGTQMLETINSLGGANATPELLALVRGNKEVAKAMVEAGNVFLQNRYADEERVSIYTYPADYAVKTLEQQIEILAEKLSLSEVYGKVFDLARKLQGQQQLYVSGRGAIIDGWKASFAWWTKWDKYQFAVEEILRLIAETRKLKNWREGKLSKKYLQQIERTVQFEQRLWQEQGENPFFFYPFQSGLWHAGRSARRARVRFMDSEFGLGSFSGGEVLLTHPQREQVWEQLHIDCSGDEYAPGGDGKFVRAPFFGWGDGGLRFGTDWSSDAGKRYGSASGFAPRGVEL